MDGRTGFRTGCLRTAEEMRRWRKLTDHQCRRVLEDAKRRRARPGRAPKDRLQPSHEEMPRGG